MTETQLLHYGQDELAAYRADVRRHHLERDASDAETRKKWLTVLRNQHARRTGSAQPPSNARRRIVTAREIVAFFSGMLCVAALVVMIVVYAACVVAGNASRDEEQLP